MGTLYKKDMNKFWEVKNLALNGVVCKRNALLDLMQNKAQYCRRRLNYASCRTDVCIGYGAKTYVDAGLVKILNFFWWGDKACRLNADVFRSSDGLSVDEDLLLCKPIKEENYFTWTARNIAFFWKKIGIGICGNGKKVLRGKDPQNVFGQVALVI